MSVRLRVLFFLLLISVAGLFEDTTDQGILLSLFFLLDQDRAFFFLTVTSFEVVPVPVVAMAMACY